MKDRLDFRTVRLHLHGDLLQIITRRSDEEAEDRGEKIFIEYFQSALDFIAVFDLPEHVDAFRAVLQSGKFCEFDRRYRDIDCWRQTSAERTSYGHDAVFGIVDCPDEWEPATLPDDWGDSFSDENDSFEACEGAAAAGKALFKADVTFRDGNCEIWSPATPVELTGVLNRWPDLREVLSLA